MIFSKARNRILFLSILFYLSSCQIIQEEGAAKTLNQIEIELQNQLPCIELNRKGHSYMMDTWFSNNSVLKSNENLDSAKYFFKKSINCDSLSIDNWLGLAWNHEIRLEFDSLINCVDKALSIDPKDIRSLGYKLANLYLMSNQEEEKNCFYVFDKLLEDSLEVKPDIELLRKRLFAIVVFEDRQKALATLNNYQLTGSYENLKELKKKVLNLRIGDYFYNEYNNSIRNNCEIKIPENLPLDCLDRPIEIHEIGG